MLPGMLRRPSFMVTIDFGGSGAAAGGGAGGGAGGATTAAAGGGGGGGGVAGSLPNCAWAVHPTMAGAAATRADNIKGATIFRTIVVLLISLSSGVVPAKIRTRLGAAPP